MRSLLRSKHPANEEGLTLVELMIALGLTAILSVLVFKILTTFQLVQSVTVSRYAATAEAQVEIDQLTRGIRTAILPASGGSAFTEASSSSMTFYANQGGVQPVTIAISTAPAPCPCTVYETTTAFGGTPIISATGTQVTSTSLFTYYPAPTPTALAPQPLPIPASGTTNPALLAQIALVEVSVTTGSDPSSPPAVVTETVNLPNVAFATLNNGASGG
ncbi:MAG: PulJ/GspJ family protein [Ferrimicrobium sp.]